MLGKQLENSFNTKQWIPAAIGAAGALGSALINSNSSGGKSDGFSRSNANKELGWYDSVSGGKASEYMQNQMFNTPGDNRALMEEAFPELNPWEIAGVGGASGVDASGAMEGMADHAAQAGVARAQMKTQKDIAMVQAGTQIAQTQIAANASNYQADTAASASNYQADTQAGTAGKQMAQQQPKIDAEVAKLREDTQLSEQDRKLRAQQVSTEVLKQANIKASTKQVKQYEKLLYEQTLSESGAKSQAGKTLRDAETLLDRVYDHLTGKTTGPITQTIQNANVSGTLKSAWAGVLQSFTDNELIKLLRPLKTNEVVQQPQNVNQEYEQLQRQLGGVGGTVGNIQ